MRGVLHKQMRDSRPLASMMSACMPHRAFKERKSLQQELIECTTSKCALHAGKCRQTERIWACRPWEVAAAALRPSSWVAPLPSRCPFAALSPPPPSTQPPTCTHTASLSTMLGPSIAHGSWHGSSLKHCVFPPTCKQASKNPLLTKMHQECDSDHAYRTRLE